MIAAHTLDGRLDAAEGAVEARKPLSVEPKLPVEITAGDRIDVPVTLANDTDAARTVTVTAKPNGLTLTHGSLEDHLQLGPNQFARCIFSFQPTIPERRGRAAIDRPVRAVRRRCGRPFRASRAEGFPVVGTVSDVLEGVARHQVRAARNLGPAARSNARSASIHRPWPSCKKASKACSVNQAVASSRPRPPTIQTLLILQYLNESDQANPAAMKQAKALLERGPGYAKLTAFEVPEAAQRQGFDGSANLRPTSTDGLRLMQFRDMARVTDVDPKLLDRTPRLLVVPPRRQRRVHLIRWLLTPRPSTRRRDHAYIIWALTESGKDDVAKELNLLASEAKDSTDPYFLALVANCLLNRDRADEATTILQIGQSIDQGRLFGRRQDEHHWFRRATLEIETTALAVLAWLKTNRPAEFTPAVRAAGGSASNPAAEAASARPSPPSSRSKALIAYTKANKKTPEAGELSLAVGEQVIAKLAFAAGTQDALTVAIPDADRLLKPGRNDVRVEMSGKNTFPYTLTWSYQTLQPPSAEGCAVRLTTALDRPTLAEGDTAHLRVKVDNASGKGQGMAVAIVGLPAGLKLPDDFAQLKDLARPARQWQKSRKDRGIRDPRSRTGSLLARLAPDAKIDLDLDVKGLGPRRIPRTGQPCVLVLQPGREMLDDAAGGDDCGKGVIAGFTLPRRSRPL